jgi:hypothetical protein
MTALSLRPPLSIVALPQATVANILSLYRTEHQYVHDAVLNGTELAAMVTRPIYPYTRTDLFHYLTAPSATLVVAQLAYVLLGGLAFSNATPYRMSFEKFCRLRDNAQLKFVDFSLRFKKEITVFPLHCEVRILAHRKRADTLVARLGYALGAELALGQVTAIAHNPE